MGGKEDEPIINDRFLGAGECCGHNLDTMAEKERSCMNIEKDSLRIAILRVVLYSIYVLAFLAAIWLFNELGM